MQGVYEAGILLEKSCESCYNNTIVCNTFYLFLSVITSIILYIFLNFRSIFNSQEESQQEETSEDLRVSSQYLQQRLKELIKEHLISGASKSKIITITNTDNETKYVFLYTEVLDTNEIDKYHYADTFNELSQKVVRWFLGQSQGGEYLNTIITLNPDNIDIDIFTHINNTASISIVIHCNIKSKNL